MTTGSLKERQPSPQNLEGEGSPIIWPISKTNDTTKITYNYNFQRESTITSETWAPVSSEGEGSPIIWPISKRMTVQR